MRCFSVDRADLFLAVVSDHRCRNGQSSVPADRYYHVGSCVRFPGTVSWLKLVKPFQPFFFFFKAIIFIIEREFMLIGWMVVYLLSYVPS
jgi:hypothetical protein